MNIQERIEALEKELEALKTEYKNGANKADWQPRLGEIIEMSNNGKIWYTQRFVKFVNGEKFPCVSETGLYKYMRPLNDPMVIQLIPHTPGDSLPKWNGEVLYKTKAGDYFIDHCSDLYWNENGTQTIVGYYLIP